MCRVYLSPQIPLSREVGPTRERRVTGHIGVALFSRRSRAARDEIVRPFSPFLIAPSNAIVEVLHGRSLVGERGERNGGASVPEG